MLVEVIENTVDEQQLLCTFLFRLLDAYRFDDTSQKLVHHSLAQKRIGGRGDLLQQGKALVEHRAVADEICLEAVVALIELIVREIRFGNNQHGTYRVAIDVGVNIEAVAYRQFARGEKLLAGIDLDILLARLQGDNFHLFVKMGGAVVDFIG